MASWERNQFARFDCNIESDENNLVQNVNTMSIFHIFSIYNCDVQTI